MGKGDNRRTKKMRRRASQKRFKARIKRRLSPARRDAKKKAS